MAEPLPIIIRLALRADVGALIALYADDSIGGHEDKCDRDMLPGYLQAFDQIAASANEWLYVAELEKRIIGTFKLSALTVMTGGGTKLLVIQSVQTASDLRGQGIGTRMVEFVVDLAKREGMGSVQLMSNSARTDAHRFYQRLGFEASHLGFRMVLK